MQRQITELTSREFDLIVVGGGIFGICAAWDAVSRGLDVALLERGDFGHAASANCFKMVHGGIRYLQHLDLVRARHSCSERSTLLRIAPHQVKPLPIAVPTYGHGVKGKEFLGLGMKVYDCLTLDRNRGITDPERQIPPTRLLSRREILDLFPGLEPEGLTGAALFHDGQMESPARLALCFLLSAASRGLEAANYVEVTRLLRDDAGPRTRIRGVVARDTQHDLEFEVRGRVVLNAAGGWAPGLLADSVGAAPTPAPTFSRDACFVVRRSVPHGVALAIPGGTRDPDAVLSRSARHLFLVPWHDVTLVGVWHQVHRGPADEARISEADLEGFLGEINASWPALELTRDDITLSHCGLVLFGENRTGSPDLRYGKRSLLIDHAARDGLDGLLTLIGVRYTTARSEAWRSIDQVFRMLGRAAPPSPTATTPIYGGDFDDLTVLTRDAGRALPEGVPAAALPGLVRDHGASYPNVLRHVRDDPRNGVALGSSKVLRAQVVQAVREEMVQTLADVVFRRTDLGSEGHPGDDALEETADLLALELGWEPSRRRKELEQVRGVFRGPAPEPEK